jgi:hypothetical protein
MFKQIGELLNEIDIIYDKMSQYYTNLNEHLNDDLSAEIISYIKTRKQLLRDMIRDYSQAGHEQVLKTWIQFTPDYNLKNNPHISKLDPDMDIEKVQEIVIRNETWLQDFYSYIIQTTSSTKVRELFMVLLERQKKDAKRLASSVDIMQDI